MGFPGHAESAAPARESRARTLVGFGVSVVSIAGCVWWASTQDAPKFPDDADHWLLLVLASVIYAFATVARGWRWDHVLRFLDIRHRSSDAYALVAVGYMGNTVLPARGGEALRIFLLAERSEALRREVLGSIIAERVLDAGVLAGLFAALALSGVAGTPSSNTGGFLVLAGGLLMLIALAVYIYLRRAGRFERFAARIRPVAGVLKVIATPRGAALVAVTVLVWCTEGVIFWMCAHALRIHLGIDAAEAVVVLASISALIPAAPGYVGTYDAAALFALHRVSVTGGAAVGSVLLFRFVIFVPVTIVGLVLMVARYGGLGSALKREAVAA